MSSSPLDPDFEDELRSLLAAGQKIAAIKRYREQTGAGLADAKNAVEALERGEEPPPPGAQPKSCGVGCLFLGLLLAGGFVAVLFGMRPVAHQIRVELGGTPGAKVMGKYVVDGTSHGFQGVLPAKFEVRAAHVSYRIRKTDAEGEIKGTLSIDGVAEGNSSTAAPFGGVSGEVKLGSWLLPTKAVATGTFADDEK